MTTQTLSQKRALAGAKGGKRTVRRYGKRHMKRLAKLGAHATHSRYRLEPVFLNDFAMVNRKNGIVKALFSGRSLESVNLPSFAPDPEFIEWSM